MILPTPGLFNARPPLRRYVVVILVTIGCVTLAGCEGFFGAPSVRVVNGGAAEFAGGTLTVVSFNMLHGFGNRLNDETLDERLALLRDGIRSAGADIVILQEASDTPGRHGSVVDTLRDSLDHLQGGGGPWSSAWVAANGSAVVRFREGEAILSRFEILSAGLLTFREQAFLPPEHRVALEVHLRGARMNLAVIATHLTNTDARRHGELVRTRQARELAVWAQAIRSPVIIGGDFNSAPGSPPILAMTAAGGRDAWALAAAAGAASGSGLTSLTGSVTDAADVAEERIDYIFVLGDGLSVVGAQPFLDRPFPRTTGGALWASDHIGVRAGIQVR
jgi:endonuclease/exonuclease/phosphatase family metal-dependent hydrolase